MKLVVGAVQMHASRFYLKIAEPRVVRIIQLAIYFALLVSSIASLIEMPARFEGAVGTALVAIFSCFIAFGSILGLIGVLPGWLWVERIGLIAITTGFSMYCAIAISVGVSATWLGMVVVLVLTFAQRYREIRGPQLAVKRR